MAETRKVTYEARIGGCESPILCDHRHAFVEAAAACVAQRGEVYEDANGKFTSAFWIVDKTTPRPNWAGSIRYMTGSPYAGKNRTELGIT